LTIPVFITFIFLFFSVAHAEDLTEPATTRFSANSTLILPENTAVIVNDADASSVRAAKYYLQARKIPDKNLIHVYLTNPKSSITRGQFEVLKNSINQQLNQQHKIVVFAWSQPFSVECNSITSAFTLGFDAEICKSTCSASKPNPYFNQPSKNPFEDFNIRLSMLLPSHAFDTTKKVVAQGLSSDLGVFKSSAYFLQTSDAARSSRAGFFPKNGLSIARTGLSVVNMKSDVLKDAKDIMIYQTGLTWVPELESLNFLPGALADHLTSFGGDLFGRGQMNVMRWLDAGATASYGTVSEPCNHWQKFPNGMVLLQWYVSGASAIEAYWKSVAWPSQGLFVGEPLAAPFAR
jgi:uncharacterized protein (TIGR03790 family)